MNIEIANRLVMLRKKHNLSQEELANKLGISRQAVSKWERAESSPDTDNLICLAKLYNISLDELLQTDETIDEIVQNEVKKDDEVIIKKEHNQSFWVLFPYPVFVTVVFLILGLVWGLWYISWILFVTIPVYYSIVNAIHHKNLSYFNYPVFIVCIYLLLGFLTGLWGIMWILFVTIPLYYGIINAINKSK